MLYLLQDAEWYTKYKLTIILAGIVVIPCLLGEYSLHGTCTFGSFCLSQVTYLTGILYILWDCRNTLSLG